MKVQKANLNHCRSEKRTSNQQAKTTLQDGNQRHVHYHADYANSKTKFLDYKTKFLDYQAMLLVCLSK